MARNLYEIDSDSRYNVAPNSIRAGDTPDIVYFKYLEALSYIMRAGKQAIGTFGWDMLKLVESSPRKHAEHADPLLQAALQLNGRGYWLKETGETNTGHMPDGSIKPWGSERTPGLIRFMELYPHGPFMKETADIPRHMSEQGFRYLEGVDARDPRIGKQAVKVRTFVEQALQQGAYRMETASAEDRAKGIQGALIFNLPEVGVVTLRLFAFQAEKGPGLRAMLDPGLAYTLEGEKHVAVAAEKEAGELDAAIKSELKTRFTTELQEQHASLAARGVEIKNQDLETLKHVKIELIAPPMGETQQAGIQRIAIAHGKIHVAYALSAEQLVSRSCGWILPPINKQGLEEAKAGPIHPVPRNFAEILMALQALREGIHPITKEKQAIFLSFGFDGPNPEHGRNLALEHGVRPLLGELCNRWGYNPLPVNGLIDALKNTRRQMVAPSQAGLLNDLLLADRVLNFRAFERAPYDDGGYHPNPLTDEHMRVDEEHQFYRSLASYFDLPITKDGALLPPTVRDGRDAGILLAPAVLVFEQRLIRDLLPQAIKKNFQSLVAKKALEDICNVFGKQKLASELVERASALADFNRTAPECAQLLARVREELTGDAAQLAEAYAKSNRLLSPDALQAERLMAFTRAGDTLAAAYRQPQLFSGTLAPLLSALGKQPVRQGEATFAR